MPNRPPNGSRLTWANDDSSTHGAVQPVQPCPLGLSKVIALTCAVRFSAFPTDKRSKAFFALFDLQSFLASTASASS